MEYFTSRAFFVESTPIFYKLVILDLAALVANHANAVFDGVLEFSNEVLHHLFKEGPTTSEAQ